MPRGELDADEAADAVRWRGSMAYAGELFPAGSGAVALFSDIADLVFAPTGRHLQVLRCQELGTLLGPVERSIAALGIQGPTRLHDELRQIAPLARRSALGAMQRPPFDGPVDLRAPLGRVL